MSTRTTVASVSARLDAQQAQLDTILAAVQALSGPREITTPATVTPPADVATVKAGKAERVKPAFLTRSPEQREASKAANKAQAAWMREAGLVPSGQAWKACSAGERDVAALAALNVADGHSPKVAVEPVARKARARKARPVTEPVVEPAVDPKVAVLEDAGFSPEEIVAMLAAVGA